ncbi:hypothetical protein SLV14_001277 [Streptomyces sp. Je 1-4]|uniref:DUF6895 family protein n=1 Tax=Streptomyces TaxID=1883 RepID=UPI0021D9FC97|nr:MULTISPECIES: hypothetical protein [unclassified Streptomyces]UYB38863.1 hypothetical protein SLV14_001277 [Streptomyces sp. Je 1-4]UZQ34853.1 hypothetical protein SLV14N_001277 [Streptomyces sp. Je 1-4] [Streptomyces sp. Je 1-4 4N24]UZQ42271.1 hypothetical protein SLV14NA_001277 [Streptomyces sp. Je 1-4] [Streptomyces sp. Je 1-4 4N24_ara]
MNTTQPGDGSSQRRAVETRAVAWLAARRTLIDPTEAAPGRVLFARKALIETAFLVGLRARLDPEPLDGDYSALLEQVEEIAARPSYRELIARDEAALLLYAGTYAALRLCGREDPEFRQLITQAAAGGYAAVFERIPYRQLDLLHTLELCDVPHTLPAVDDVLPFTLLCNRPNVVKLTDRDIYALTHTLFYATDFGLREPRWPRDFNPGAAVELLEALLVLTLGRQNADLVGELLCCLLCLGVRDSEEGRRAWEFLAAVQEADGRVNGPPGVVHPGLADGDEEYRHWATGYHTTIVTALAALLDRSPRVVRRPRPSAPKPRPVVEQPLRRAVVWLADTSRRHAPAASLPAAAAVAHAAGALGEPELARPLLLDFSERLADADAEVWQGHGMEVVGEFAYGLRTHGITCASLDLFLKSTAAAVELLDRVPPQATHNVRRLVGLGLLAPQRATALTGGAEALHPAPETAVTELPGAWKDYRLGHIAGFVRDSARAGRAGHRITRDAVSFLLSQQSSCGAFGRPACDEPSSRERALLSWTQSAVTALAAVHTACGAALAGPRSGP